MKKKIKTNKLVHFFFSFFLTLNTIFLLTSSVTNWLRKPESSLKNVLMSGIEYNCMAIRSRPKPNAQPILSPAPTVNKICRLT